MNTVAVRPRHHRRHAAAHLRQASGSANPAEPQLGAGVGAVPVRWANW
jgi:hypothetical protein